MKQTLCKNYVQNISSSKDIVLLKIEYPGGFATLKVINKFNN